MGGFLKYCCLVAHLSCDGQYVKIVGYSSHKKQIEQSTGSLEASRVGLRSCLGL